MFKSVAAVLLAAWLLSSAQSWATFDAFESGPVRPLAASPDGARLFAVNTPDNRLEIFEVSASGLNHTGAVAVGLEPVAVAARSNGEVWVVNHLSDSVSIVDVSADPPRVVRTLLVGDEPRDIVFAGPGRNRAFVTAAHRGQSVPFDPQLTTPGVGRGDVWVFDAANLGAPLGGTPLTIVTVFGDTLRGLAASADGNTVYAAVFHSGNRSTTVHAGFVCDGGAAAPACDVGGTAMPGGLPPPNANLAGVPQPEVGLIVKHDGFHWLDELGRWWDNAVRFDLPDRDVFAIDAGADPPAETANWVGVGTVLFNLVANPVSGKVYVSNTEARNEVRFEGAGVLSGSTVRGHLHEARVTVLDGAMAIPRHLNKHIDYGTVPSQPGTREKSLAQPVDMAVSSDGATLYVAAFGSGVIGVFDTAELESDAFVPDAGSHIPLGGGGPAGLVLDEANQRLYVLTRFDNSISVVDTDGRSEIAHVALHNPEPPSIIAGRRFLYDASLTSSNGETSCASCHVFGDLDSLAWDLGDPDGDVLNNQNPLLTNLGGDPDFHPMKGPMTTQSLRGMAMNGPMHWRGDRTGALDEANQPPDSGAFNEVAAFKKFNPAFVGLLGRDVPLTAAEIQSFADFVLQIRYPPNPNRNLDNSLTPDQQSARNSFFGSAEVGQCSFCHRLDVSKNLFGTDGRSQIESQQTFKVPHLRNLYQKIGMFGMPSLPGVDGFNPGSNGFQGDQIRGFGFVHDGSVDTLFRFLNESRFNRSATSNGFSDDTQRRAAEAFLLAFDTGLAPMVGQQVTLSATADAAVTQRLDLLLQRAAAGDCDAVVKGTLDGVQRGWVRQPSGQFASDRLLEPLVSDTTLRQQAASAGQERTYTCVPPGAGRRIGVDRDDDGFPDADEADAGSDPADPSSVPGCNGGLLLQRPRLRVTRNAAPVGDERLAVRGEFTPSGAEQLDPSATGLLLVVRGNAGEVIFSRFVAPGNGWRSNASLTRWTFRDETGGAAGGITRAVVRRKADGSIVLRVAGRKQAFHVDPASLPPRLQFFFGQGADGCTARSFSSPECRVSPSSTVSCDSP